MQRLVEVVIALVALACAVGGHGLPLNVLGSLAIGWGVTAVVRLVFGRRWACRRRRMCGCCWPTWAWPRRGAPGGAAGVGVARFEATDISRTDRADRLGIAVYGRDAADARLLTKAGRFVLYWDSGPGLRLPGCSRLSTRPI